MTTPSQRTWQEQARLLPCGQRKKVLCECGGHSLLISNDLKGIRAYCFHASHDLNEWEPHTSLDLRALYSRQREWQQTLSSGPPSLPSDATTLTARQGVWMSKYGIHSGLWNSLGFKWSEKLQRVVLPVMLPNRDFTGCSTEVRCIVARSVNPHHKPKYLNSGPPGLFADWATNDLGAVVLTEDILSAIKVGFVAPAASSLASAATDYIVGQLAHRWRHVVIWYDGDGTGDKGARAVRDRLGLAGLTTSRIRSPRDPKCYSRREIKEILDSHEYSDGFTSVHVDPSGVQ